MRDLEQVITHLRVGDPVQAQQACRSLSDAPGWEAESAYLRGLIALATGNSLLAEEEFRQAATDAKIAAFHRYLGEPLALARDPRIVSLFAADLALRPAANPLKERVALQDVTLCCLDSFYIDVSLIALKNCLSQCSFSESLFFTDQAIALPGIRTVPIPALRDGEAYSRALVQELPRHIQTSHALIVQWDGFVLNGQLWRADFLQQDYIGARWMLSDGPQVGNGGFSLRSRRFLEASADPTIAVGHPEDFSLCRTHRSYLEQAHGIRFASGDLADHFSIEAAPVAHPTFGFHGLFNLRRLINPECPGLFVRALPKQAYHSANTLNLLFCRLTPDEGPLAAALAREIIRFVPQTPFRASLESVAGSFPLEC